MVVVVEESIRGCRAQSRFPANFHTLSLSGQSGDAIRSVWSRAWPWRLTFGVAAFSAPKILLKLLLFFLPSSFPAVSNSTDIMLPFFDDTLY